MLFHHASSSARAALRTRSPLATGARFASASAARPAVASASRWSTAAATVALAGTGLYFAAAPALHLEGRVSYADRLARLPRHNEEALSTKTDAPEEAPKYSERVTIVTEDGEVDDVKVQGNDAEAVEDVAETVVDAELATLTAEAEAALGENDQSAAFDPRTGEINWDCPCLGGMAHGPCGEEFKLAFSCFVFSEVEPKGIECVEKFQNMQTCFRKHPDVYAEEIADDDEASRAAALEAEAEAAVKA